MQNNENKEEPVKTPELEKVKDRLKKEIRYYNSELEVCKYEMQIIESHIEKAIEKGEPTKLWIHFNELRIKESLLTRFLDTLSNLINE